MTDSTFTIADLEKRIQERASASAEKSYTRQLLDRGVAQCAKKFGEEAVEAVLAAVAEDKERMTGEAADVLYHLLVMLLLSIHLLAANLQPHLAFKCWLNVIQSKLTPLSETSLACPIVSSNKCLALLLLLTLLAGRSHQTRCLIKLRSFARCKPKVCSER